MKLLTLTILLYGWCSQYSPGVMENVVMVRQAGRTAINLSRNLPQVDGFVALKSCADIGQIVLLRKLGETRWERFLVVDCAAGDDGTIEWMDRNNIIAEIDGETAKRWDVVGTGFNVEMMRFKTVTALMN